MNQPTAILIGLAVGIFARRLFLRQAPGGLPLALLLGVAGSMFAAFLMLQLGLAREAAAPQFALAIGGAAVLLLGYRLDLARQTTRHSSPIRDLKAQAQP